jgi:hypothetical protein
MKKVKVVQDNDCHWFVIPNEMLNDFNELLERMDVENDFTSKAEEIFIEKFSGYMTGGDINLTQLYIPDD